MKSGSYTITKLYVYAIKKETFTIEEDEAKVINFILTVSLKEKSIKGFLLFVSTKLY